MFLKKQSNDLSDEIYLYYIQISKSGSEILDVIKNYDLGVYFVYDCMINKNVVDIIEELMNIFSKNFEFLYSFLDGWDNFWTTDETQLSKNYANNKVYFIFKNMIIKFIRLDNSRNIKNEYFIILKKHFNINFYGEVMMG
jgi:hypothetical protein